MCYGTLKNLVNKKHLVYTRDLNANSLKIYADANWRDQLDRESTTEYLIKIFGNIEQWKTIKQRSIALSSAETACIALLKTIYKVI